MSTQRTPRCTGITEGHERVRGQVKWYDFVKGYGFIGRENEKDVFVHLTAVYSEDVAPRRPILRKNETVEFYIAETPKGVEAREVSLENGQIVPKRNLPYRWRGRRNGRQNRETAPTENVPTEKAEGSTEKTDAPKENGNQNRRRGGRRGYYRRRRNNRGPRNSEAKPTESAPAESKPEETKPAESN